MENSIDRLINSIGVSTFVKYFNEFSKLYEGDVSKSEIRDLFIENSEPWNDSSITTKINVGLKIFTLKQEIKALEHIVNIKKTSNIPDGESVKERALKLLKILISNTKFGETVFPIEVDENQTYPEGTTKQVTVNSYERNPFARQKCIEHFGLSCQVCEFNFEQRFGELGKNFIHVHHLVEISTIGKEYSINPIIDLIPVCPNCHAMLHKRNPAYSLEELKLLINN